ncbi:hypothetical protein RFI_24088 [Reticulomyxa filosa]|uniref:Uncharacterized protein n=1 Tax=Reticulomyxa filosa TaxID=46433 RepID=X6MHC5_RETFI|nr:hypothetical protein RFI_24088 [Reticulomyxa filosa]|eukprot:ETO13289.1 hypothetical protein RFI_24088 [Reticulomyxa filosa]
MEQDDTKPESLSQQLTNTEQKLRITEIIFRCILLIFLVHGLVWVAYDTLPTKITQDENTCLPFPTMSTVGSTNTTSLIFAWEHDFVMNVRMQLYDKEKKKIVMQIDDTFKNNAEIQGFLSKTFETLDRPENA